MASTRAWHHNGQLAADERYEQRKLVSGKYYDASGKLLAAITNGTGRQYDFYDGRIRSITGYRDGLAADQFGAEQHQKRTSL